MAETIVVRCDNCEGMLRSSGREVFIATFLRTCLGLGWRNLDNDAQITRAENLTCIKMAGLCPDCTKDFEEVIRKNS